MLTYTTRQCRAFLVALAVGLASVAAAVSAEKTADSTEDFARSYLATTVEIPMRDGIKLAGNLITPGSGKPAPVVVSITPYQRHRLHAIGAAYASIGLAFLGVDTRGRGDSEGEQAVFYGDLEDTLDVIAWAAKQPFSDGQVAMLGASYGGFGQWMAAAKGAPALKAINPLAAVYPGLDFPMTHNVGLPYAAIWTGFTKGRMANFPLFGDQQYWREAFTELLAQGIPFTDVDEFVGLDSDLFDEWVAHPNLDSYWRALNPTDEEMASIDIPILSVTGLYDGAQPGALKYYRQHMANASEAARAQHFLVIGPYEHAGVSAPTSEVGGLPVRDAGGIDPIALYGEWNAWHMLGAPRPEFLQDRVMYYVMEVDEWRAAPSIEAIPVKQEVFYLSGERPTSVTTAGSLTTEMPPPSQISYVFDPADISKADLGIWFEGDYSLHDADVIAIDGDGFVFETAPFTTAIEIIGQPRFDGLIGIDTPDADFRMRVYEVRPDGSSILISVTHARARYREGLDKEVLLDSAEPREYSYDEFLFASRRFETASKLRFVFDPPNSIYIQRNYNAAKPVEFQTPADAQVSTVTMLLGGERGARLTVPMRSVE